MKLETQNPKQGLVGTIYKYNPTMVTRKMNQ